MKRVARMIKAHREDVMDAVISPITHARAEGIKRMAAGFAIANTSGWRSISISAASTSTQGRPAVPTRHPEAPKWFFRNLSGRRVFRQKMDLV